MAARDQESQEVMSAAMRYVKSGDRSILESFSLPVLRKADYQLGDRDSGSGYRNAIRDRITEIETQERNKASVSRPDIVYLKPNIYGFGINLKEVWRRVRQWWTRNA